jgi:hypothetical protein
MNAKKVPQLFTFTRSFAWLWRTGAGLAGIGGDHRFGGSFAVLARSLTRSPARLTMATLNTRNVHRSNMLMGFPYGTDFVYDEMVLTG